MSRAAPSVFLSRTTPHLPLQSKLLAAVTGTLAASGLEVRALDSHSNHPLETILETLDACAGTVAVVLARSRIDEGQERPGSTAERPLRACWQATPWSHIELALAFQQRHPILLLIDERIPRDGLLDPTLTGATGTTFAFHDDGWTFAEDLPVLVARFRKSVEAASEPPAAQ